MNKDPGLFLRKSVWEAFPSPDSGHDFEVTIPDLIGRYLSRLGRLKSDRVTLGSPPVLDSAAFQKAEEAELDDLPMSTEEVLEALLPHFYGMMNWGSPYWQANVIPPSATASIVAAVLAVIINPNLVQDEYCQAISLIEVEAIAMTARLIGYEKGAVGFFTFGGTGTLLYGVQAGIARVSSVPRPIARPKVVLVSDRAHYSARTVSVYSGIDAENVVPVATDRRHSMRQAALRRAARKALRDGHDIAAIIGTVGTTDAFGLDDIRKISNVRDELVRDFGLPYSPHVHADAVAGWAWSVFKDYDFDTNQFGFSSSAIESLRSVSQSLQCLHLADSVGVDFHKTGFAPYASSAIIFKSPAALNLLSRDTGARPALFQTGSYHPGLFTLETTRAAVGAVGAWAVLKKMGKLDFQEALGRLVQMACSLRAQFECIAFVHVLNRHNNGPVTLLRVFPDRDHAERSKCSDWTAEDTGTLDDLDDFNTRVFNHVYDVAMAGHGPLLGKTMGHRIVGRYGDLIRSNAVALRAYMISPSVHEVHIDHVVRSIVEAREHVLNTWSWRSTERCVVAST